jgi:hypothetical protein
MTRRKVLLSANDAGAAHHMVHLARLLRNSSSCDVLLVAGPVAGGVFARENVSFQPFSVPTGQGSTNVSRLIVAAETVIREYQPDLFVNGLSNLGHGPDEALAVAVRRMRPHCVTATLLDDRGPLHTLDGKLADHLLATSRAIEVWASRTGHTDVIMIGSLKHHALSLLPVDEIRRQAREEMGLTDAMTLVTFIAQSDAMHGHNERFRDLAVTLERRRADLPAFELLIRVHPGAPNAGDWCFEEAKRRGLPARRDADGSMTKILTASDALFSCSSTSMTDYVWLALGSKELKAVPVYLIGPALRKWLIGLQGTWKPDLVERGLAYAAVGDHEFDRLVVEAVRGELRAPNCKTTSLRDSIVDPFVDTMLTVEKLLTRAESSQVRAI